MYSDLTVSCIRTYLCHVFGLNCVMEPYLAVSCSQAHLCHVSELIHVTWLDIPVWCSHSYPYHVAFLPVSFGRTYPCDIAKHVWVKGDVVLCDVEVTLEQDVAHQGAGVTCNHVGVRSLIYQGITSGKPLTVIWEVNRVTSRKIYLQKRHFTIYPYFDR